MKTIVAVDSKWGIGKKNDLLFSIPEDMAFFRKTTMGKVCCMGYNTLLSFPGSKPLKNRTNIVLAPADVQRDGRTISQANGIQNRLKLFLEVIQGIIIDGEANPHLRRILFDFGDY